MSSTASASDAGGARPDAEFDGLHEVWPRGARLEAICAAASAFKQRFMSQGEVIAVRSANIAAASYPVRFAFPDAVIAPYVPFIAVINRMLVVRFRDWPVLPTFVHGGLEYGAVTR